LYDEDKIGKNDLLGTATIPITNILALLESPIGLPVQGPLLER